MDVKDIRETDANKEQSGSNPLAAIRRIMGRKSKNAFVTLAILTGGIGCVGKYLNDKQPAENEKIEIAKHIVTREMDAFSKPDNLSIQEFEQKLALSGYSTKTTASVGNGYVYGYSDIYDGNGNNVGAYLVVVDNSGSTVKMGPIQINSNDELGNVLNEIGCNKVGSVKHDHAVGNTLGKEIHEKAMKETQARDNARKLSNRIQQRGCSTR